MSIEEAIKWFLQRVILQASVQMLVSNCISRALEDGQTGRQTDWQADRKVGRYIERNKSKWSRCKYLYLDMTG